MPATAEEKQANARAILGVFDALGGDGRPLVAMALRESGLNARVKHVRSRDRAAAEAGWRKNPELFGNNPSYGHGLANPPAAWSHGYGLLSFSPGYHLHRWDSNAHPSVLYDPYVNAMVAARLAKRFVQMGAKTWADVNQGWATGSPRRTGNWGDRRKRLRYWLKKAGYPPELADVRPELGFATVGPMEGQEKFLVGVRTVMLEVDQTTTSENHQSVAPLLIGAVVVGLGALVITKE